MKKQTLQLLTPAQINALCELRGKVSDALQHIDVILNNQTADAVYSRIVGQSCRQIRRYENICKFYQILEQITTKPLQL